MKKSNILLIVIAEIALISLFLPHKKEMVINKVEQEVTAAQKTLRVDMFNYGIKTNKLLIKNLSDKSASLNEPAWLLSEKGQGCTIQSQAQKMDFVAELSGDGYFVLKAMGIDKRDKTDSKRRIPVCIKITKLLINDNSMINAEKVVWADSPFIYKYAGKNGEILNVHIEWQPFVGE